MISYFKVTMSLLAAVLLVFGCSSDPAGIILPDEHSLGWGYNLADAVRDIQFPDGVLFMLSCADINDEGKPETGFPWMFYYAESSDSTNVLIVFVQYIGTTNYLWEDSTSVPTGSLPDYDDAGPWLDAARDSMGSVYSDWEEYSLIVQSNDYPEFPVALNVAVLQFVSPDTTGQLTVILDSDNDNVLGIFEF